MPRAKARRRLLAKLRRSPYRLGYRRSRWTLGLLLRACDWLRLKTVAGLSQLLDRLGISHQRAQAHTPSPDAAFVGKRFYLDGINTQAGPRERLLYMDELTYDQQPSLERAWEAKGHQPVARQSSAPAKIRRLRGAVDAHSGRLFFQHGSSLGRQALIRFYQKLASSYRPEVRLHVVQDNVGVHLHPDVLARLEPQRWPFAYCYPHNWPDPSKAAAQSGDLSIQAVFLPTYAAWLNPIERLWRKLKQEVLHLHRWARKPTRLRKEVESFMTQPADTTQALLRYLGLLSD